MSGFTVPGIEESLQKILGIPVNGAKGGETAGQTTYERLRSLLPPPKVGATRNTASQPVPSSASGFAATAKSSLVTRNIVVPMGGAEVTSPRGTPLPY